jgi:hypothetical protein
MSPRGRLLWPESYVLKLTHKHLTEKKNVRYTNTGMLVNLPLSNIIETSEDCIHVHQRHQDITKPALVTGRVGERKNKKRKSQNIQPYKIETQTLISILLKGRKNAWLDDVLFFLQQAGERKNLPTYTGKSRIPSVRFDRIHRLKVRIESRSCIESFILWLVRVVDTATTPRQQSLPLDCLSMHVCPQIQHACKQTDL